MSKENRLLERIRIADEWEAATPEAQRIASAVLRGEYSGHDGRSGFESYDPIYVVDRENTEPKGGDE
jgi:hypothetical protein